MNLCGTRVLVNSGAVDRLMCDDRMSYERLSIWWPGIWLNCHDRVSILAFLRGVNKLLNASPRYFSG